MTANIFQRAYGKIPLVIVTGWIGWWAMEFIGNMGREWRDFENEQKYKIGTIYFAKKAEKPFHHPCPRTWDKIWDEGGFQFITCHQLGRYTLGFSGFGIEDPLQLEKSGNKNDR